MELRLQGDLENVICLISSEKDVIVIGHSLIKLSICWVQHKSKVMNEKRVRQFSLTAMNREELERECQMFRDGSAAIEKEFKQMHEYLSQATRALDSQATVVKLLKERISLINACTDCAKLIKND